MAFTIISLVPSLTETVIDLGRGDWLIGRTKFCIHPSEKVKDIAVIGGTKNPHVDKIIELNPSLVIANKEENRKEDIERLRDANIEVIVTDVYDIESAKHSILDIGAAIQAKEQSEHMVDAINENLQKLIFDKTINAIYLIWKDPYMTIGGDTYISAIMDKIGLNNLFKSAARYPEVTVDDLSNADVLLLSSEPYPFKNAHAKEIEERLKIPTIVVDGECFSWYGSRMIEALQELTVIKESIRKKVEVDV